MEESIQEQDKQAAVITEKSAPHSVILNSSVVPATTVVPVKHAKSMNKHPQKMKPGFPKTPSAPNYKRFGRELAMQFLYQCDMRSSILEKDTMENFQKQAEESGLFGCGRIYRKALDYAQELISVVLADKIEIDTTIERYSKSWDLERMSAVDRNILRTAIAEMRSFDTVPLVVSINEAIEISKDFSDMDSKRFINGLLNSVKIELESQKA